jgi:hypothetical protein
LVTLLDRFEQYDSRMLEQANRDWSHLHKYLDQLEVQIIDTSRQLVRCKTSLRFWTDVSQGTVQGPLLSMMTTDAGRIRAMEHLPRQYVIQLRAELAALPRRVDHSSLAVFRQFAD